MVDRINDIAWQAHQGSVAAIIQLLNDKLATLGVRTRAIFSDGILHILCEGEKVEQLEQTVLVEKIKNILETTAPRNIRRVNINSRIVREEQLLWLEEISRDQDKQLLWSEEITLTQPNFFQQIVKSFAQAQTESGKVNLPKTTPSRPTSINNVDKHHKSAKTLLMVTTSLFSMVLLGWFISREFGDNWKKLVSLETLESSTTSNLDQTSSESSAGNDNKNISNSADDPFGEAVRIANQASAAGKKATNSTQWLELAAQWQKASDLMGRVSPSHVRYEEAQIRTKLYKRYSETAQKEAEKSQL
ncbi:MAG TPA: hypothetical protein VK184_18825 [Nostocaceae cyanobacterium]|nr:hypothetical protein [Nostocaceae cyanobacterium]